MPTPALSNYHQITSSAIFTQKKLKRIREKLASSLKNTKLAEGLSIVATGSYGRCEACDESDIDLFTITDKKISPKDLQDYFSIIEQIILTEVPNLPGTTGTFGVKVVEPIETLITDIGGLNDDNKKFTRRMLFLLEGTWLFNEERFNKYRKQLMEAYIKEDSEDRRLNKFFLNDIIRYYRTIATDYEFKVREDGKAWGVRNIKLRFSRKLLYFSGLIVVAETSDKKRNEQLSETLKLLDMPPLERVVYLSKSEPTEILSPYETFLSRISNPTIRDSLKSVKKDTRQENIDYITLRDIGRNFSSALSEWLDTKYGTDHQIHHSLVF